MNGPIDIYYDQEGDFLEITLIDPPEESYCEDIKEDVYVRKDQKTNEVVGLGIFNFTHHATNLKELLANVPVKINFETTSDA